MGNPDRTISADRRVIDVMRLANLGFAATQYYTDHVPSVGSIARLVVSATVRFPGLWVEIAKRDIASACRLLRLPPLSLLMCTEIPCRHLALGRILY